MEKRSEKLLLVVDSSILFSYFMLSKKIRRIIQKTPIILYTPDWAIHELNKYFYGKIAKKVLEKGVSKEELEFIVLDLMERIIIVPKAIYQDKFKDAFEIAKQFDLKDAPFIALALKLSIPIWTNDKKLIEFGIKTGRYLALDTKAVEDLLNGKSLNEIIDNLKDRYCSSR
ncbi:PIN domain-containing protein [Archaeoglobus sp.]